MFAWHADIYTTGRMVVMQSRLISDPYGPVHQTVPTTRQAQITDPQFKSSEIGQKMFPGNLGHIIGTSRKPNHVIGRKAAYHFIEIITLHAKRAR